MNSQRPIKFVPSFESLERRNLLATVELMPVADNTLYEAGIGNISNGKGQYLFAGRVAGQGGGALRRAAIEFDLVGQVPDGATINSVSLELTMSKAISQDEPVSLHRALAQWGEGTSDASGEEGRGAGSTPGDATWIHSLFPDQEWNTPGGDFESTASSTIDVAQNGRYTWTSDQLATDVAQWLAEPSTNFGWIVVGSESVIGSAKRFDSREHPTEANRPTLIIDFDEPSSTPWQNPGQREDVNNDNVVTPIDALVVLNRINLTGSGVLPTPDNDNAPPPYVDANGDGSVTPIDALVVINFVARNPPSPEAEERSVDTLAWPIDVALSAWGEDHEDR